MDGSDPVVGTRSLGGTAPANLLLGIAAPHLDQTTFGRRLAIDYCSVVYPDVSFLAAPSSFPIPVY